MGTGVSPFILPLFVAVLCLVQDLIVCLCVQYYVCMSVCGGVDCGSI